MSNSKLLADLAEAITGEDSAEVDILLMRAIEALQACEWKPIEEAPTDGTPFEAYCRDDKEPQFQIDAWCRITIDEDDYKWLEVYGYDGSEWCWIAFLWEDIYQTHFRLHNLPEETQ